MRVLVIFCHPRSDSFAGSVRQTVTGALEGNGHTIDLLDLYAEGFNPVMGAQEWGDYLKENVTRPELDPHIARLKAAEGMVLVFPTWWYGLPAILKGWFDRVLVPGVAFKLKDGGGVIQPCLHNIRYFAVVTSYGSPFWFIKLLLRDPVRAVTMGGLRRLMSNGAKTDFLAFYNIDTSTQEARTRFIARVRQRFAKV